MWETLYASTWHHPGIAWVAGFAFTLVLVRRLPFLAGFLVVFTLEIMADALCTSPLSPVPASLGTAAGITFVILGDLRYFVLLEACSGPRIRLTLPGALTAVATAFVVPLSATAVRLSVPAVEASNRNQFLVYESFFFALALALRLLVLPRRLKASPPPVRAWLSRITLFEILQYGLWIAADLLLLAGIKPAFGVRLLPNIMYYALFLPFVLLTAPPEERSFRARPEPGS